MKWTRLLKGAGQIVRLPEISRAMHATVNWPSFAAGYLLANDRNYPRELRLRSGKCIGLENPHDLITAWIIFCRQEYTVDPHAKVIVDIGANYGAFTLFAAHRAPYARIFSVEPFPQVFDRLLQNVASHGLKDRVHCSRVGVADSNGNRNMDASGSVSQSRGLLSPLDLSPGPMVTVETLSLKNLLEKAIEFGGQPRINLVKMDIEGGEHELIPQITPEILQNVDAWQMEYHPNGSSEELFRALNECGFRCTRDQKAAPNSGVAHFVRIREASEVAA